MKKLLVATLFAATASTAFAAETGNYVFGNVGISANQWTLKDGAANRAGVSDRKVNDDDATSGMVEIGVGQRINDNFAVEGSYLRHGDATGLNGAGSLDYDTFRVAALGIIPVTQQFEVYGKVSANHIRSKFNSSSAALASSKALVRPFAPGAQRNTWPSTSSRRSANACGSRSTKCTTPKRSASKRLRLRSLRKWPKTRLIFVGAFPVLVVISA